MFRFLLNLAVISMLPGDAATSHTFTSSAELNITLCPITYYGQKYDKLYVSFTGNKFAVCFNGLFKPGTENDCIVMSSGAADRGNLFILTKEIPFGSVVHKRLPSLQHTGKCVNIMLLTDHQQSEIEQVELGNFWKHAVLAIKTFSGYKDTHVVADLQVNGLTVSKQKFLSSKTRKGVVKNMSGCRLSGGVYKLNTKVKDPTICSTVTCHMSGVADSISYCGRMERCHGDGSCIMNTVCSVTGSTVIDFIGRVHFVPDRCAYTLLRSSFIPGFQVLGFFQERRRIDRSFLERVVLHLDTEGVQISLEQGGRVLLNDRVLMLSAMVQVFHGVEISKDQTGVTVKISACSYTISVFFDGYTALIHMTGSSEGTVHGLCDDSYGTLCDDKLLEHSATDCEIQYEDTADSSVDCHAATERCNLLIQAPFTACNTYVDPKPFITACIKNLCSYPAVDGFMCQFLQAYSQTCRYYNVTVENWRLKNNCSSRAFCQDQFCSAHEFCGEGSGNGETRCYCRASFAHKHKTTSSFGDPIVCGQKFASVNLANCLLVDAGIDYSALHLNDQACKGKFDELTHMVTFSFNSSNTCGAVITANESHIVYTNTIMMQNISSAIITRKVQVQVDFSCYYVQPDVKSFAIRLRQSSVIKQITSGEWDYNLTMAHSERPTYVTASEPKTNFQPNGTVWVELKANGLDEKLVIVTQSCWVTDQPSPGGSQRSYLIVDGCSADQAVKMACNGQGTSNYFSLEPLNVSNKTDYIHLFCKVVLCVRQKDACIPECSNADRRCRTVG
ncbi:alpha-tectorin-like [Melanotaenia boesemani]|uniref:alpha-tectorin-like n=1 Tax=Melanotaenia boesemani TaxID=1250792 RepID=UPI001C0559CD|nr:alpha-tectorin-like [Melanotaenia boesemani]